MKRIGQVARRPGLLPGPLRAPAAPVLFQPGDVQMLKAIGIVMPFVALGVAGAVAYWWFKPKIDVFLQVVDVLKTILPILRTKTY